MAVAHVVEPLVQTIPAEQRGDGRLGVVGQRLGGQRRSAVRALIRTSTASWRAYVATTGLGARSRSPSISATCDSPIPWRRSVRTTRSAPTPRSARRGSTCSAHMGRISRGGPGSVTITRPSGRSTHQPGAVPLGLGSEVADGMTHACFTFTDGNGWPRRAQRPLSQSSVASSTDTVSSQTAATASRVRSSGVGPRPPVVTTRSARESAVRSASTTTSRSSGRSAIRETATPWATSERASSPLLVSVVSPTVSSEPIARSSAVRIRRGAGLASSVMAPSVPRS